MEGKHSILAKKTTNGVLHASVHRLYQDDTD
jgi:hypothetical protein